MQFFKCTKPINEIKEGDIIVDSLYHWQRTLIIATPRVKTIFTDWRDKVHPTGKDKECFIPLTMKELNKIKPHLRKVLLVDYRISFNEDILRKLPDYVCYDCGVDSFNNPVSIKQNTIGRCKNCNSEKKPLYITSAFKIDVFKKTYPRDNA